MKCPLTVTTFMSALALVGVGLGACSPSQDNETSSEASMSMATETAAVSVRSEVPASATLTGVTVGGDGSSIQLIPLTPEDIEAAKLGGELACNFSIGNTAPLLLAKGIVASDEPAFGVVKVAGYVERIAAPGGFEGITTDPTFTGQGKTIKIALTGPAVGGGESPYRPATLTYMRADGAELVLEGRWNCGA